MGAEIATKEFSDSPIAWFAVLEAALQRGDLRRAAQAQEQLRRLGVTVRFGRLQSGPAKGGVACNK